MGLKAVNIPSLICSYFSKSVSQNHQEGSCQPLSAFGCYTIEIYGAEMHPTDA